MQRFAQILSNIFQPLLFPTYGMILLFQVGSFVYADFMEYKLPTVLSVFLLTAVVPLVVILFLKKMGLVSSIQLANRKERTIPYVFTIFSYAAAIIFLYRIGMPFYVVSMMTGVVFSTILIMLINLKWKVSAHLSAIGGLCAAIIVVSYHLYITPLLLLSVAFVLAGLLASARIILKMHTPMQTLVGFCIGFTVVYLFGQLFINV